MKSPITLFALFLLFNCHLLAQSNPESNAEEIIEQNIAQFSKDLMAGNYEAVVAAYTKDAKIFPNNLEILSGTEAIRQYWTPPKNAKSRTTYHKIKPQEIKITGNEAYDWGYYEGTTTSADGQTSNWKGKYVIIWKEIEPGVWKIYLDIWNRVK
jgi:ketosteroid isomerase-like protein